MWKTAGKTGSCVEESLFPGRFCPFIGNGNEPETARFLFQPGQAPSIFLLAFDGSEGAVLVGGEDVVLF